MNRIFVRLLLASSLVPLLASYSALAFPPAPYHLIYGTARDQYGTPLSGSDVSIVLETPSGVQLSTPVVPGLGAGINYELKVPMDAGLTPILYQPDALIVAEPFVMYVVIGSVTNLPLQTSTNYTLLGQPGQSTRIDLTLGVDSNGDGIPDAWEQSYLAALGLNLPLSALNANLDLAHDGRTLLQEFLLGDYPFDPGQQFMVSIVGMNGGSPLVEFPTTTGRSYTLLGSTDMQHWFPLSFHLPTDTLATTMHTFYYSLGIGTAQAQIVLPADAPQGLFIKLLLQ
jgi:hypothetical protein